MTRTIRARAPVIARARRGAARLALGLALAIGLAASLVAARAATAGGPDAEVRADEGRDADAVSPRRPNAEETVAGERPRDPDTGPAARRARREAMRGLLRALPEARPVERLAIVREAMRLPFDERRALRERLRRIDELAPDERSALVAELEGLLERANDDVDRLERNLDRWEKLSEAERERYRAQMRRLQEMPFEERQRLLDEWERAGRGERAD